MVRKIRRRGVFMSDLATVPGAAEENAGVAALTRLTKRISTLVPPPAAANLARPQPSPAVRAGLARAQMLSSQAARRARPSARRSTASSPLAVSSPTRWSASAFAC
jgi:hypothetical protein